MRQTLHWGICNSRLERYVDFWGLLTKVSSVGRWHRPVCSFRRTQAATLLEFLVPLTNCFVRRWFCVVLGPKLRCTLTIDSVLANCKTQNAFLSPAFAMFRHDCLLAVKRTPTSWLLLSKQTWRDALHIDVILPSVSFLDVALPIWEVQEAFMNYRIQ
jgi:hypothetical protein